MSSHSATRFLLLLLLAATAFSSGGCDRIVKNKRTRQAYAEIGMFRDAVLAYRLEYSVLPLATPGQETQSNRDLYAMLHAPAGPTPGNPRGIPFVDAPLGSLLKGEFIDPWGLAYHVAVDHNGDGFVTPGGEQVQDGVAIWSSGDNRINESGSGDDLCSWR